MNTKYEMFNEDVARFIRIFANDVKQDVWCEMGDSPSDTEEWFVCAVLNGQTSKYRIPDNMTVGAALRMFPEFANVI